MRSLVALVALSLVACEGPTGSAGPTGPQGPQGGPGISGRETVSAQFALPNNGQSATYDVNCSSGKVPLSGGYTLSPTHLQASNLRVLANAPTAQGWRITLFHQPDFTGAIAFTLTVHAVCATVP